MKPFALEFGRDHEIPVVCLDAEQLMLNAEKMKALYGLEKDQVAGAVGVMNPTTKEHVWLSERDAPVTKKKLKVCLKRTSVVW